MSGILEMLSYHFMQRALIVGILVSLCAALLGVPLVLKRYSMIGDGLSHVGFGSMAVATALNAAPLAVAIPVVMAASVFLLRLNKNSRINGEAAVAVVSSSALAIGIITASVTSGMNTDISSYMFGSILTLSRGDTVLSAILSVLVMTLFLMLYPRVLAVTFDETFGKATGIKTEAYNTIIAVLTSLTIVLGMRMMGALLISSLIIFPALSSMQICRSFKKVAAAAAVISVICFTVGITTSFFIELPTGASIVVANLICFAVCTAAGKIRARG